MQGDDGSADESADLQPRDLKIKWGAELTCDTPSKFPGDARETTSILMERDESVRI